MLVVSDGDPAPAEARTRWVMDPGYKRRVTSETGVGEIGIAAVKDPENVLGAE